MKLNFTINSFTILSGSFHNLYSNLNLSVFHYTSQDCRSFLIFCLLKTPFSFCQFSQTFSIFEICDTTNISHFRIALLNLGKIPPLLYLLLEQYFSSIQT